jgi:RNA polymerase sigma-70 factor, ECF subfamily
MDEDERSLVAAAKSGSRGAIARLFDLHWAGVWRAAFAVSGRRDLADDVAQDAFLQGLAGLATFDQNQSLRPWLTRIAVNRTIDILRREARTAPLGELVDDSGFESEGDPALLNALARLAPDRRAVVVLRYWLGYQMRDIAQILEVPPGTVASRLNRALSELRTYLEEDDD